MNHNDLCHLSNPRHTTPFSNSGENGSEQAESSHDEPQRSDGRDNGMCLQQNVPVRSEGERCILEKNSSQLAERGGEAVSDLAELPAKLVQQCKKPNIRSAERAAVYEFFERVATGRLRSLSDVMAGTNLSEGVARRALKTLVADGALERLGFRGPVFLLRTETSNMSPTITQFRHLLSSVTTAEGVPPAHGPASPETRTKRLTFSPSQARDSLTALNHFSGWVQEDADTPLPSTLFRYTPDTNDWAVIGELDKHLSSPDLPGGPLGVDSRAKVRSSLRYVLDVACNHGLIAPTDPSTVLPVEWLRWLPSTEKGRSRRLRVNCIRLAQEAIRLGILTPEDVNWPVVGRALRRQPVGPTDRQHLKDAVSAFNALGLKGLPPIRAKGTSPACLFPAATLRAALAGDWSGWCAGHKDADLSSLVNGPTGLAAWVRWTRARSAVELDAHGLPSRRLFTLQGNVPCYLQENMDTVRAVTLERRLRNIGCMLASVLHNRGAEYLKWMQTADLIDSKHVMILDTAPVDTRAQCLTALADLAGFMARVEDARGNSEGAIRLLHQAALLRNSQVKRQRPQSEKVSAVVGAFAKDAKHAWATLLGMREAQIERIVLRAGLTVEDQLSAMERGETKWQSTTWAREVRDLALLNLCLRVPLRNGTANKLRIRPSGDITIDSSSALWRSTNPTRPWEGAIALYCEPDAMKAGRTFRPAVIVQEKVGVGYAEAALRRDLFALYLHPCGARAFLIGPGGHDSGWMWLKAGGGQVLACHFFMRRLIENLGPALGVDVTRLAAVQGQGLHAVRHVFGSHFAPTRVMMASKLLDHSNTAVTEKYYCSYTASDADVDEASLAFT